MASGDGEAMHGEVNQDTTLLDTSERSLRWTRCVKNSFEALADNGAGSMDVPVLDVEVTSRRKLETKRNTR